MLLSMTGYGRARLSDPAGRTYAAELRALNSKQADLRLRSSHSLREHEVALRKLILDHTRRGKLEMTLDISDPADHGRVRVDLPLLKSLAKQIHGELWHEFADHGPTDGLVGALLRTPGIVEAGAPELLEKDWSLIQKVTMQCLSNLHDYRRQEGRALAEDLGTRVRAIENLLSGVDAHAADRIQRVRDRMERHLTDYQSRGGDTDRNRYEQEVIFYLEKMDINEEKVRLTQNCQYFREILDNEDEIKGRKLTFISQEIGREINTLGAKAYSADIQKLVVGMKEHLDMVKEQLANVA